MASTPHEGDPIDITIQSNGLRQRRIVEKIFAGLAFLSAVIAVAILAIVLGTILHKGLSQLSVDFFTKPRPLFGEEGGIADALAITEDTVKVHVKHVMDKLGASDRTQAVVIAVRRGIIHLA